MTQLPGQAAAKPLTQHHGRADPQPMPCPGQWGLFKVISSAHTATAQQGMPYRTAAATWTPKQWSTWSRCQGQTERQKKDKVVNFAQTQAIVGRAQRCCKYEECQRHILEVSIYPFKLMTNLCDLCTLWLANSGHLFCFFLVLPPNSSGFYLLDCSLLSKISSVRSGSNAYG